MSGINQQKVHASRAQGRGLKASALQCESHNRQHQWKLVHGVLGNMGMLTFSNGIVGNWEIL